MDWRRFRILIEGDPVSHDHLKWLGRLMDNYMREVLGNPASSTRPPASGAAQSDGTG